VCGLKIW